MDAIATADWAHVGRFCGACDEEIQLGDRIVVNEDGETDADGWRDLTTVRHAQCPEAES